MQEKTMTPTTLAAALIAGVPRKYISDAAHYPNPTSMFDKDDTVLEVVVLSDVLAALTAALDGVDERAGAYSDRLRSSCFLAFDDGTNDYGTAPLAADMLTALLAQNAALRAEVRKSAMDAVSAGCQAQEAYEAQKAAEAKRDALRKERDALRKERDDALTFLDNAVSKAPEPLKALGKYLAGRLDEDEWPTAEQHLNAAAKACADHVTAAEAERDALRAEAQEMGAGMVTLSHEHSMERARANAAEAREERLRGALSKLHHAVCGETGFAACVRLDSGKAYPWPALDDADEAARAALTTEKHHEE